MPLDEMDVEIQKCKHKEYEDIKCEPYVLGKCIHEWMVLASNGESDCETLLKEKAETEKAHKAELDKMRRERDQWMTRSATLIDKIA